MAACVAGLVLAAGPAWSQALGFTTQGDEPIEIEADDGIEWHRNEQVYIARGNAMARQTDVTVEADTLTAYYRQGDAGTQIYRIDADGNVRITSTNEVATGDKAVYDVIEGVLVITGDEVQLEAEQDRLRARDSLEYYIQRQLAVARGDAQAERGDQRVRADVLMAHYRDGAGGLRGSALERVEAVGDVVIVTADDVVRAERGDYNPNTGIARMAGDVKITRGDNQLNGEFAEVNFNTGISRLLAGAAGEAPRGRVRALIVPNATPQPKPDAPAER